MASTSGTLAATGSISLTKPPTDTLAQFQISGTYGTVQFVFEASVDGTNFFGVAATIQTTGAVVTSTQSPTDNTTVLYNVPSAGHVSVRLRVTAIASGTLAVFAQSDAYVGLPTLGSNSSGNTFSGATFNGTASAFSVMPTIPTATVAAAGTVQGDAAAITTGFTLVTGSTNAGVKLPAAAAGLVVIIKNNVAGNMKVWPNTSDAINAIAADSAYTMATVTSAMFVAYDAVTWYSIPLVAS